MKLKTKVIAVLLSSLVCFATNARATFVDNFDAGLGNWTVQSGDWSILPDDSLKGAWSYSAAFSTQGVMRLNNPNQPTGDFKASIDFKRISNEGYYAAGWDPQFAAQAFFGFIQSDGRRFDIGVNAGTVANDLSLPQTTINAGAQIYNGPTAYTSVGDSVVSINWNPNVWNTLSLFRTGNLYELYLNDVAIYAVADTTFGGAGDLALKTYGVSNLDNFTTSSVPETSGSLGLLGISLGAIAVLRRRLAAVRPVGA